MNRLHLRIYNPADESADEVTEPSAAEGEARDVLPFTPRTTRIISGRITAPVDRARLLRENSTCPECGKADVEPIELQDATISPRSRLPIPGTATIVGFHCNCCGIEWPVYDVSSRRNG